MRQPRAQARPVARRVHAAIIARGPCVDRQRLRLTCDALISVHSLLRSRRCATVRSFSCSSLACSSFGGKIAGSFVSSGLMYFSASVFGLPEPIRLVSSAEFLPSSMKLMNWSARSGRGARLVDHHVVDGEHRAFLRHALQDVELAPGGLRVEVRLEDVVRVAVHEPDVADGQLLDVRRRVERRPVRLRLLDHRRGLVPVLRVDVVGRVAEVLQRRGEELVRAVEHRDAALHLLQVLRIEDHRPRVGRQAQLLHLLVVVADDRRRHRVRHRVLVARVERRVQVRGSMFFRFGSFDLSIGFSWPPRISACTALLVGTSTS